MENFGRKLGHGFLILSLLVNLVFIGSAVTLLKTNWLDLPLVALILSKNCDHGGIGNLMQLPNPQLADQLSAKFCQNRPRLRP